MSRQSYIFYPKLWWVLIVLSLLILLCSCSISPTRPDGHWVEYDQVVGTTWYGNDDSRNTVDEITFYKDSLIVMNYQYSPFVQYHKDIRIGKHQIIGILKFKGKIEYKDREYHDGDGDNFYIFRVSIKPYNLGGAPVTDWALYEDWFIHEIQNHKLYVGKIDPDKDVQIALPMVDTLPVPIYFN